MIAWLMAIFVQPFEVTAEWVMSWSDPPPWVDDRDMWWEACRDVSDALGGASWEREAVVASLDEPLPHFSWAEIKAAS